MDWQSTLSSVKPICHHQAALSTPPSDSRSPSQRLPRSGWTKISTACPQNWAAPAAIGIDWICPEYVSKPERRGRKPGTSWNGGRRVESMAGIAVGGWLRSPFNAGTNSLSLSPKHLAILHAHQRMWEVAQNHFIPNRTHPRPITAQSRSQ